MNETARLEECVMCGEPTGRAGRGDDSIFCECDTGPLCLDCWHAHSCPQKPDEKIAQGEIMPTIEITDVAVPFAEVEELQFVSEGREG